METMISPVKNENQDKKVYYGDSSEVNSVENYDYNDYLNLTDSKQDLKGFGGEYRDFVDYILKITHRIWEEKSIGLIYDTYHNNVTMHFGSYNAIGIKAVISGTLQTLHAFPDRKLIGQNVIWSPMGEKGYLSSHRIMSTATNLNDSSFGKATGKAINFRTVVDCAVENNRIYEEWLVRDNLWIVKQLGIDPHTLAKEMALTSYDKSAGMDENLNGQLLPELYKAKDETIGEWLLQAISEIYNYRLFNKVTEYYDPQVVFHYICDRDLSGFNQIKSALVSLFASFPNANYRVDRVTVNQGQNEEEYNVAVRWRLSGLHEGLGEFGPPSMKPIEILGINHLKIVNRKIVEEWMTYDGLDVLKQIYSGFKAEETDNEPK